MTDRVSDRLFAKPRRNIADFAFDESVAAVFPDMIERSIPGYKTAVSLLSVIAAEYFQPGTRIYDLGCSLGASTIACYSQIGSEAVEYIAIDNSAAMVERCRHNFARHMAGSESECRIEDVRTVEIDRASVVIMNFTLQFLPVKDRQAMIARIEKGLRPGGVFILSEKVDQGKPGGRRDLSALYHAFKAANGYSALEISQKRTALEKVMKLDSAETHARRLESCGFTDIRQWFQCFNFISLVASKAS